MKCDKNKNDDDDDDDDFYRPIKKITPKKTLNCLSSTGFHELQFSLVFFYFCFAT